MTQKLPTPHPQKRFSNTPVQKTAIRSFGTIVKRLEKRCGKLEFEDPKQFRQLKCILEYLAPDCQSVIHEQHYIDRHFNEDHGAFYARGFTISSSSCERLHFFRTGTKRTMRELLRILAVGQKEDVNAFRDAARSFSGQHYLGFLVLKPLHGTPVGRCVLQPKAADTDTSDVTFNVKRTYPVHIGGIELDALGAAFQEQDVGVSACATTALWSSLQHLKSTEQFGVATPAQITGLASVIRIPTGHAMPSEGLTAEQMCHSINALGLVPQLVKCRTIDDARFILYIALRSGFAPIILIQSAESDEGFHAVTAVGSRIMAQVTAKPTGPPVDLRWNRLGGLYVHDDRQGPYLQVQLDEIDDKNKNGRYPVIGPLLDFQGGPQRNWRLVHVLLPLNSQIRYPLWALHRFLWDRVIRVLLSWLEGASLGIDCWLTRPHDYFEQQIVECGTTDPRTVYAFQKTLAVPRYLAVVRVESMIVGKIDVLIDMTSTPRNDVVVAIVANEQATATQDAVRELTEQLGAPRVFIAHPTPDGVMRATSAR